MDTKVRDNERNKRLVVEAIERYQQRHPGWSPSDDLLHRETALPIQDVKYLLRQLESEGRIGVVGNWPRQLWVIKSSNGTAVLEEAVAAPAPPPAMKKPLTLTPQPEEKPKKRVYARRLPLKERAKQIAAEIDRLRKAGQKVQIKNIAQVIYDKPHTGRTSQIVAKMVAKGWLKHGHNKHNDFEITEKGYRVLLGRKTEPKPEYGWKPYHQPTPEVHEENVTASEAIMPELRDLPPKWEPEFSQEAKDHMAVLRQEVESLMQEPRKVEWRPSGVVTVTIANFTDEQIILELINRGYTVSKR